MSSTTRTSQRERVHEQHPGQFRGCRRLEGPPRRYEIESSLLLFFHLRKDEGARRRAGRTSRRSGTDSDLRDFGEIVSSRLQERLDLGPRRAHCAGHHDEDEVLWASSRRAGAALSSKSLSSSWTIRGRCVCVASHTTASTLTDNT